MHNEESQMDSTQTNQPNPNINDLVAKVKDLPPLPNIVSRAMEIAHDPNGSVRELQILIAKDQALSAKILRIVNSAMYALRREVSTERAAGGPFPQAHDEVPGHAPEAEEAKGRHAGSSEHHHLDHARGGRPRHHRDNLIGQGRPCHWALSPSAD